MKLNKKGEFLILGVSGFAVVAAVGLTALGHYKYDQGEWGKNGTDSLMQRQAKIVANGGHINTSPAKRQTFDYYVQP